MTCDDIVFRTFNSESSLVLLQSDTYTVSGCMDYIDTTQLDSAETVELQSKCCSVFV